MPAKGRAGDAGDAAALPTFYPTWTPNRLRRPPRERGVRRRKRRRRRRTRWTRRTWRRTRRRRTRTTITGKRLEDDDEEAEDEEEEEGDEEAAEVGEDAAAEVGEDAAAEVGKDAAAEVGEDAAVAVAKIVTAPDAAYEDLAWADLPADVRDAMAILGYTQELWDGDGISEADHRDWDEKILDAAKKYSFVC